MTPQLRRITRADALAQGFTDRQLAQLVRTGTLRRVRPGEFALPDEWSAANPLEQHRELVLRTAERVTAPQIYSHHAAAALHGIRIRGRWPNKVDVLVDRSAGGRSSGRLRRHALGTDRHEIVEHEGLLVTSPAQTVIDLARTLPFIDGVVAADSALGTAFGRARLTTPAQLLERLEADTRARGTARARAVVSEADGRAESPPETESRMSTVLLGFPRPELQKEFTTTLGTFRLDLWWPEQRQGGECDGAAKYSDPEYLRGRTPQEVFRREKERGRALLALPEVRGLIRWEPADLSSLTRFYDILRGAGLPSRFGRPTAASWARAQAELVASAAMSHHPRLS